MPACVPGSRLLQPMTLNGFSFRLLPQSGTIKSGSIFCSMPSPAHVGHAPKGLLKEKERGESSSMEMPQSGQARFWEKSISRSPGPISAMTTPPERESAVSSESVRRLFTP